MRRRTGDEPDAGARRAVRQAGAGRGPARSRLRGRVLRSARVADGRRSSGRWPRSTREAAARGRRGSRQPRRPPAAIRSCCSGTATSRASSTRCGRASRCSAGAKLTFDEESKALYDAVAPHHDAQGVRGACWRSSSAAARAGLAARPLHAVPRRLRDPAGAARRHLHGGHRGVPPPDAGARARCRPARASRSSTSPARAGAATTGIRATTAA